MIDNLSQLLADAETARAAVLVTTAANEAAAKAATETKTRAAQMIADAEARHAECYATDAEARRVLAKARSVLDAAFTDRYGPVRASDPVQQEFSVSDPEAKAVVVSASPVVASVEATQEPQLAPAAPPAVPTVQSSAAPAAKP